MIQMEVKAIWFDMDGTIADLYGDKDWLAKLSTFNPEPYANARPLVRMQSLARVLNSLQKEGYKIGIISWLSKTTTAEYSAQVAEAKREWLAKHLASVRFDYIDIVEYGTPKQNGRSGILFDDEEPNRKAWNGQAYDASEIIKVLRAM